jgi:hypothetical protein
MNNGQAGSRPSNWRRRIPADSSWSPQMAGELDAHSSSPCRRRIRFFAGTGGSFRAFSVRSPLLQRDPPVS